MRKLVYKNSALQNLFWYGPHKYKKVIAKQLRTIFINYF